jgi:hypothetical protein
MAPLPRLPPHQMGEEENKLSIKWLFFNLLGRVFGYRFGAGRQYARLIAESFSGIHSSFMMSRG